MKVPRLQTDLDAVARVFSVLVEAPSRDAALNILATVCNVWCDSRMEAKKRRWFVESYIGSKVQ